MAESGRDTLLERLARRVFDQVRQRFGVGLRREAMTGSLEPGAQDVRVLDDPVVNQGQRAVTVGVRMRVTLRRSPMRRPARVADATAAVHRRLRQKAPQARDASRKLAGLEAATVQNRDPGGVVAAILEPARALHQNRRRFSRPNVPNDSAHRSRILWLEFEQWLPGDRKAEPGELREPVLGGTAVAGPANDAGPRALPARLPAGARARGLPLHALHAGSIHVHRSLQF